MIAHAAPVRRCACGGAVGPTGECAACRAKRLRREAKAPQAVHDVVAAAGRPLDPAVRETMERQLGHDFSRVRIHTDVRAAESVQAVGATAYTVGDHVAFAGGAYSPSTSPGRRLLAHELAHVVQQHSAVPSGPLRLTAPGDAAEREAAAAADGARPSFTRTGPVLARQVQQGGQAAAAQCGVNCTDPQFLALSRADREARLSAQCPNGFTASATTFFGESIPSVTVSALRTRMLAAQAPAMREMCLNGRDPLTFRLPGPIITYDGHSPAEEKAVDIDVHGQPYLMHETTRSIPGDKNSPMVAEADIDRETRPVFDRVVFWTRYRDSIVPAGITSVTRPAGTHTSERQWRNPLTGAREQITVGELYDILSRESRALGSYFTLLQKSDAELATEIDIFLAVGVTSAELAQHGLPPDSTPASVQSFRRRIADDYRLLGGSAANLRALAGQPTPSTTPSSHLGDRPFQGRRPEEGFLTVPREVIVALTDQGLTWGAIDFSGGSGDVMHIDCRGLPGC